MTGIKTAKYEYIAMIDADRSYPGNELNRILDDLGDFDMIIGARKGRVAA